MAKLTPRHKPQFLWQAVWILLPMAVLAGIGLVSLRKDRLLAEQEASESGKILAQRLSQAIRIEAARQLHDYREASFTLQMNRAADLGQSRWRGGAQEEVAAWQHIKAWQQANPDIDLAVLPPTDGLGDLESNFTFVNGITTQPATTLPQPPPWLGQLTGRQAQLWQSAKESTFKDDATAQAALKKFIDSNPPKGARANAEYLLLLAKARRPGAATKFSGGPPLDDSLQLTDAGLPIGQLIRYQGLRVMPDGAGVPEKLIRSIGWLVHYQPSIFSPRLVAEVERVAKGTNSATNAAMLKSWWDAERAGREVLDDFREQFPTNTWSPGPFWVNSDAGKFLLLLGGRFEPSTKEPAAPTRYGYLLFPQSVVEKALATAVRKADIALPTYARVEIAIGNRSIVLSHHEVTPTNGLPILGQTAGAWEDIVAWMPACPFQATVFLENPKSLYARQSQRTLLFGLLIVVSTLTAMVGLLAAWRSFHHQQQLNESKTSFVSSVSHELRAPIAAVRLMAENLERGKIPDAPRQNEYFRFIVQECRRLSSLIENVLDFSRIEQGRKQYDFEETDIVALAQTTVKLMAPYAAEKGVCLKLETDGAIESEIDGRALQQALVNLIDNAVKHSPKGESVAVELRRRNDAIELSVTDHGPGIPRGEQERIFERFYRLGSELRRETQGVGIGLSVVKHIVEAHHGRVLLESEIGKGSRFTIQLPLER